MSSSPSDMSKTELLTRDAVFAESPRWHQGELWFSDVHDYALKAVDLQGRVTRRAEVPGRPAGIGFMPDGRLLLATARDRKLNWVSPDGSLTLAADLASHGATLLNDMVVDGRGRAYVGDTGFDFAAGDTPAPGRVFLFTEDGNVRVAAEDVTFPNGCAVSADGSQYFVAETLASRVSRFEIADDGLLINRTVFAQLDSPPDGLCLDAAGGVWIAQPHAGRFLRLARDGSVDQEVLSAAPFAVACVLGDETRSTLFMSSADTDLQRLSKGDSKGRIDTVNVAQPGAGWP